MGRWSADRLAATSGIAFVVLFIVSFFSATKPPDSTDSNAQWVTYFVDHHRATLISAVLLGAAVMFFIWFAGSVGAALRTAGEQRLAAVAFGGGVATAAMGLSAAAVQGALAYGIAIENLALIIANTIAFIVGATTIAVARHYRA